MSISHSIPRIEPASSYADQPRLAAQQPTHQQFGFPTAAIAKRITAAFANADLASLSTILNWRA